MDTLLTQKILAASPRYRRKSSAHYDAIHDLEGKIDVMAPAQLYSTESGRLFHAGRIVICTVGLPARGKTHIAVSLARYLRWLGVKCRTFHLGDYRRATLGPGNEVPDDYFHVNASPESVQLRETIVRKCREDMLHFLDVENGQVAIYDAVNPTRASRQKLAQEFDKKGVHTLFFESVCTDESIVRENVRNVKISSPDYYGWDPDKAVKDYLDRISAKIPHFETMTQDEHLNYIQMINAGESYLTKNISFGYLHNRILFYLMNLHIKNRQTYFARAAVSSLDSSYKGDAPISESGQEYAEKLAETIVRHREEERQEHIRRTGNPPPARPLVIWTSDRQRSYETAAPLEKRGYTVHRKNELSQLNPGIVEQLTDEEILQQYPEEVIKHNTDPYHHRYPRAESYHDIAVRLEGAIMDLESITDDVLIIAHESVLRVLYGYLMACHASDIPTLRFRRNEIIEILPAAYNNTAKRITIPGLANDMITSPSIHPMHSHHGSSAVSVGESSDSDLTGPHHHYHHSITAD